MTTISIVRLEWSSEVGGNDAEWTGLLQLVMHDASSWRLCCVLIFIIARQHTDARY